MSLLFVLNCKGNEYFFYLQNFRTFATHLLLHQYHKTLKSKFLPLAAVLMLFASQAFSQTDFSSVFSTFRLEARADFDYFNTDDNNIAAHERGFTGRYFNLKFGGNISEKFSYYVCQRLVANPGSNRMFDNTDFLYLGYAPNKNWMFKAGKDLLLGNGRKVRSF